MLEALFTGLISVMQWPAIGYLLLGVVIGVWLGAVPGLGGILGLIVLIPFTYNMPPVQAFALLLGMFAVTVTGDTVSSVLIGVPGTSSSAATVVDGYPLAKQGKAGLALGAAYMSSAVGGVFGALVLAISLPVIKPVIFAFGSPEIFMLCILGLAMVGSLSGDSVLKGLTVASLGLFLTTIGYGQVRAVPRYWFELDYLVDGLTIFPVVFGLFALPEVMDLAIKNISISRITQDKVVAGGILDGIKSTWKHRWLLLRSSALGTYIGFLPGLGPNIADWVAYGHAVQSAKDKSLFGRGEIRGVIAPEAANNSCRGGELIPTLAFGIPGSLGAAILMSAMIIQGLKPGPEMLTSNLYITFSLVWTLVIANIVAAGALMIWSNQVVKLAFVPGHLIVPIVVATVLMGAWLSGGSMGDWISCLIMSVLGYVMKRSGWPRPPIILAMVLGNIMENTLHLSLRAYGFGWLLRPIVIGVGGLIILTLVVSVRGIRKKKNKPLEYKQGGAEDGEKNPVLAVPFTAALAGLFVWAAVEAFQWEGITRWFPQLICVAGAALALFTLYYEARNLLQERQTAGGLRQAVRMAGENAFVFKALQFFGYVVAVILLTPVLGQKIVLSLFIGVYVRRWGGYGWRTTLVYAVGAWGVLIVLYGRFLGTLWYESWLSEWLPSVLPGWLPPWLFV